MSKYFYAFGKPSHLHVPQALTLSPAFCAHGVHIYIYTLHIILRIEKGYCSKQHQPVLRNASCQGLLCGRNWIYKYLLLEIRISKGKGNWTLHGTVINSTNVRLCRRWIVWQISKNTETDLKIHKSWGGGIILFIKTRFCEIKDDFVGPSGRAV